MKRSNLLSQNLAAYQKATGLSNAEFAAELCISESTLRAVKNNGNTTLDTLMRISDALNVDIDSLVHDEHFSEKLFLLNHIISSFEWLDRFASKEKHEIVEHIILICGITCE